MQDLYFTIILILTHHHKRLLYLNAQVSILGQARFKYRLLRICRQIILLEMRGIDEMCILCYYCYKSKNRLNGKVMKKQIIIFLALLGVGSLYSFQKEQQPDQLRLSDRIGQWLETEEAGVRELLERLGITEDILRAQLANQSKEYTADIEQMKKYHARGPQISDATRAWIYQLFKEFGIDSKAIEIVPFKDHSAAAATDHMLFINEAYLKSLSQQARRFAIAHEIQHIRNRDDSKMFVLQQLLPVVGQCAWEHPYNVISRFHEMRADLQAIRHNGAYVQGQEDFLTTLLNRNGEGQGITHPILSSRIQMVRTLLSH